MEEIQVYGPFISRKQAKEQGLNHFFTGKSCIRGSISLRNISGHCLCDLCKEEKKIWRAQQKEIEKQSDADRYANNKEHHQIKP